VRSGRALAAVLLAAVAAVAGTVAGCGGERTETLRLMYAGSLIVPFDRLAAEFERTHPEVDVTTEAHGSIQVLRHVTELGDEMDIVASADEQLIPPLMYERDDPDTGAPYATWSLRFATNTLVLAVSPRSPLADRLSSDGWWRAIRDENVRFGLADPRFDAAGYRGLMALALAERHYDDPFLFEDMVLGQFTSPVTASWEGERVVVSVPEVLETRGDARVVLRGSSVHLLGLLESGDVDCAFEYESVARQHGLRYATLPAALDMGHPGHAAGYRRAAVRLDFRRFASVKPEFGGDVIHYALTIPANSPSPELAAQFVAFLLGPEGQRVLRETYQPVVTPHLDDPTAAPEEVRRACGRAG
jgi:molybdate/tungstate transport system substrate-binding protein